MPKSEILDRHAPPTQKRSHGRRCGSMRRRARPVGQAPAECKISICVDKPAKATKQYVAGHSKNWSFRPPLFSL